MPLWEELLKTALLGTERGTLPNPAGDDALSRLVRQTINDNQSTEDSLWQQAVLTANYRLAGTLPVSYEKTPPVTCESDPRPLLHENALRHLRLIINDMQHMALLPEWLQTVRSSGCRAQDWALPELLDFAAQHENWAHAVFQATGARGRWLARQNPAWRKLLAVETTQPDAQLWEEGSLAQRFDFLCAKRRDEPQIARQWLEQVWPREAARERSKLLEALETSLEQSDAAFLEAALNDKSKEVRTLAASMLARLPQSPLQHRLRETLQHYLLFDAGGGFINKLLQKKGKLDVVLPEAFDKTWSRDGIVEKAPKGKGEKAYWLEQMLGLVAPSYWCERWHLTPQDLMELSAKHEWKDMLRAGWRSATLLFRDTAFAHAWLHEQEQENQLFWTLLDHAQAERLLTDFLAQAGGDDIKDYLFQLKYLNQGFSLPFSFAVIDAAQRYIEKQETVRDYHIYTVFRHAQLYLHLQSTRHFEDCFLPLIERGSSEWRKILSEVLDMLRFRQDMTHAIVQHQEVAP